MSWSLPLTLQPNSPRKELEPKISFSESVGGGIELLAGQPNEHSFRKLSECPAVDRCSWETPT